jgi:hypothetical protein
MSHSSCKSAGFIRGSVKRWLQNWVQEYGRCPQCDGPVSPRDSCCPICGQSDPVKIPVSTVVYLVLGFLLLTGVLSSLVWVF